MPESSKSVRYDVTLNKKYTRKQFSKIIEKASDELDVYISHIGGYSRVKYPNSIHWHFKEHPKEKGCLELRATVGQTQSCGASKISQKGFELSDGFVSSRAGRYALTGTSANQKYWHRH